MLVPGLWFPGIVLHVLAYRLRRQNFGVLRFSYPSVRQDLTENARRLARFLDTLDADTVHLVGHSLGGLVIRALFDLHPGQRPGRIVTIGTPHGGCRVAQHLSRQSFWRLVMGRGTAQLLTGEVNSWALPERDIGVICGTRSIGMGKLLYCQLPRPNDGLLTVKESAWPAAREHLALPVSHSGMLFSRAVARRIASFLRSGCFSP